MKSWKSAVINWERRDRENHANKKTEYVGPNGVKLLPPEERDTDLDMIFSGEDNGK
ncbi:MAG: hypothetical protein IJK00_04540 [Clostridia bacterium]|nr:hypothetical protein [Clostridia bacterium]MBR6136359.1 hypothetical protein [Clostridia bacterium]